MLENFVMFVTWWRISFEGVNLGYCEGVRFWEFIIHVITRAISVRRLSSDVCESTWSLILSSAGITAKTHHGHAGPSWSSKSNLKNLCSFKPLRYRNLKCQKSKKKSKLLSWLFQIVFHNLNFTKVKNDYFRFKTWNYFYSSFPDHFEIPKFYLILVDF